MMNYELDTNNTNIDNVKNRFKVQKSLKKNTDRCKGNGFRLYFIDST